MIAIICFSKDNPLLQIHKLGNVQEMKKLEEAKQEKRVQHNKSTFSWKTLWSSDQSLKHGISYTGFLNRFTNAQNISGLINSSMMEPWKGKHQNSIPFWTCLRNLILQRNKLTIRQLLKLDFTLFNEWEWLTLDRDLLLR